MRSSRRVRAALAKSRNAGWDGSMWYPRKWSSLPSWLLEISIAGMTSGPSAAAAIASPTPAVVSWSVRAMRSRPPAFAARTTAPGESAPSEAVEWMWRSMRTCRLSFGGRPCPETLKAGVPGSGRRPSNPDRVSVPSLGHGPFAQDRDDVVDDLEEAAADSEPILPGIVADPQVALAEEDHEGRVVAPDPGRAVPGRGVDEVRLALEDDAFGADHRAAETLGGHGSDLHPEFLGVLDHVLDPARHEERLFREVVELARDDALERLDGVREADVLPRAAGELFGHEERLGEEALDPPGAPDDDLVLLREL